MRLPKGFHEQSCKKFGGSIFLGDAVVDEGLWEDVHGHVELGPGLVAQLITRKVHEVARHTLPIAR